MEISSIDQNQTNFKASLNLIANKRCLPKGATKRLTKLAQTIGINTDTITIGVLTKGTNKTIVRKNLWGCRWKDQTTGSLDTCIRTMAISPSKKLFIPHVEKIIPGTKYPNAMAKYFNSKEIKMNNYKEIYRYMLDLKDKFKSTV